MSGKYRGLLTGHGQRHRLQCLRPDEGRVGADHANVVEVVHDVKVGVDDDLG